MENNQIMLDKIQKLMEEAEFVRKLENAKTVDASLSLLRDNGITVTADEIEVGYRKGMHYLEDNGYIENGELTEAGLDMVSGGSRFGYGVAKLGSGVAGAGLGLMLAGVCLTPAAGFIIVGTLVAVGCFNL